MLTGSGGVSQRVLHVTFPTVPLAWIVLAYSVFARPYTTFCKLILWLFFSTAARCAGCHTRNSEANAISSSQHIKNTLLSAALYRLSEPLLAIRSTNTVTDDAHCGLQ